MAGDGGGNKICDAGVCEQGGHGRRDTIVLSAAVSPLRRRGGEKATNRADQDQALTAGDGGVASLESHVGLRIQERVDRQPKRRRSSQGWKKKLAHWWAVR